MATEINIGTDDAQAWADKSNVAIAQVDATNAGKQRPLKVVNIGDSNVAGFGGEEHISDYLAVANPSWSVVNEGVGGDSTVDIIARLATIYTKFDPAYYNVATVLTGLNDEFDGIVTGDVFTNLTTIVTGLLANGCNEVFLMPYFKGIIPTNNDYYRGNYLDTLNDLIKENEPAGNYSLIDPVYILSDSEGVMLSKYWRTYNGSPNGTGGADYHLSELGNYVVAQVMSDVINGNYEAAGSKGGAVNYPSINGGHLSHGVNCPADGCINSFDCVNYFSGDNPDDTQFVDDVGSGTTTLPTGITLEWDDVLGDGQYAFDGSGTAKVLVPLSNPQKFTVSMWVKANSTTKMTPFGGKIISSSTALDVNLSNSANEWFYSVVYGTASISVKEQNTIRYLNPVTEWNHIILEIDKSNNGMTQWVNGQVLSFVTDANIGTSNDFTQGIIGANSAGTQPFAGKMKHIAIFDRLLNSVEREKLFTQSKPLG
jgi:hypothetical protein